MYAKHRSSDTLEKEDVSFAVSQLFPEVARENKSPNLQLSIDHQVLTQFPLLINQGEQEIGVGGQPSTSAFKSKLLKVYSEQEKLKFSQ